MSNDDVIEFKDKATLEYEARLERTLALLEGRATTPCFITVEEIGKESELEAIEGYVVGKDGLSLDNLGDIPLDSLPPYVRRALIREKNTKKE